MKIKYLLLSLIIALLTACGAQNPSSEQTSEKTSLPDIQEPQNTQPLTQDPMTKERITYQTNDGVTIVGDFTSNKNAKKAALLLHMMPEARESYTPLAEALNKAGYATLAIDLRGHGESTAQTTKKLNYKNFTDVEHQASRLDVDAAINFLKGKGFNEDSIVFVGASIGANLALDALSRYGDTTHAVLLSPGLDYRGVKTESVIKNLTATQKVWIVAAEGDKYSADSTLALQQLKPDTATMTIFGGSDHGTTLFSSQKLLIPDIVKFLES